MGIGLSALPIDLIAEFINRPKKLTEKELKDKASAMAKDVKTLVKLGNTIKTKYSALMRDRSSHCIIRFRSKRKGCSNKSNKAIRGCNGHVRNRYDTALYRI